VSEDDVREFLIENPDFLKANPELLGVLQIPHASGSAVSLVERQVSVLRERNVDLRHRLRELGTTAKGNDQLFADTRELVLALLAADSLSTLESALITVLRERFDVEYARLMLFSNVQRDTEGDAETRAGIEPEQATERLKGLISKGNAGCGVLRSEDFAFLFPGAKIQGSAAVALIVSAAQSSAAPLGLVAVGSSSSGHYDSAMGTLFLEFAAEVLAILIPRAYGA
jgi:uncharacterized protein YigA (DUF484 family)